MTQRQGIAAVTATLSELVATLISGVLPMTKVTNLRPSAALSDASSPSVNVFLYRAAPNASLRNQADPVRNAAGQLVRVPAAAWSLQYLLTFGGEPQQLEPELLFGAVLTGLNANAVLPRSLLRAVDDALASETGNRRFAAGSNLDAQVELVKLTPLELSIAELTELFGSASNPPYALSIAYEASVVLLSPEHTPRPVLPVGASPRVVVAPLALPRIASVADSRGAQAPITIDSTLVIRGERLRGAFGQVRIGLLDVDVGLDAASDDRIELMLSPPDAGGTPAPRALAPGALGVQVRQRIDVSANPSAPELRPGATSNVVPIVLRPVISGVPELTSTSGGARIVVSMAPAPRPEWEYRLLLSGYLSDPPRGLGLGLARLEGGRLEFDASGVPAGEWLIRLQVNGAESVLVVDAGGAYSGPRVTLP
ncbi:MAG TPA: DUF4255 domain-containing protein [Polyangiaceae bacterium]|nr:DUF4255 domain-containing protein [Polyangiaceae bacterium]